MLPVSFARSPRDPSPGPARPRVPLLAMGFRPFFLAAGLSGVVSLLVWLAMLQGLLPGNPTFPGSAWHAHEMLFGYGLAVIAGFLLTAVPNWTGQPSPRGAVLGLLVGAWLLARVLPWLTLPAWLAGLLAAALPLGLALSLWRPLWRDRNRANRVFLGILAGMALAAAWSHLRAGDLVAGPWLGPERLMLDLILLTLLIVSGRVLPFFTRVALPGAVPQTSARLEAATFAVAGVWLLASPWPALSGLTALLLAALVTARVAGWHDWRVWGVPLLAVLYAGAGWLVFGLLLSALAAFGLLVPNLALHALTVGAVGVFTLGMMVRVTLGHTGRPMRASRPLVAAFVALNLAALVRVVAPLLWPAGQQVWVLTAGTLWAVAFATFLVQMGPLLLTLGVDGKPVEGRMPVKASARGRPPPPSGRLR